MRAIIRYENGELDSALDDAAIAATLGGTRADDREGSASLVEVPREGVRQKRNIRLSYDGDALLGPKADEWAQRAAITLLRSLTEHPDPQIAERAKAALRQINR